MLEKANKIAICSRSNKLTAVALFIGGISKGGERSKESSGGKKELSLRMASSALDAGCCEFVLQSISETFRIMNYKQHDLNSRVN